MKINLVVSLSERLSVKLSIWDKIPTSAGKFFTASLIVVLTGGDGEESRVQGAFLLSRSQTTGGQQGGDLFTFVVVSLFVCSAQ